MASLGLLTGNPAYIVLDLIAVGLALWICLASIGERPNQQAVNQHSPTWVSLGGDNQTVENGIAPGTADGYAEHSARLAAQRKLAYSVVGKPKSIAITVKRKTVRSNDNL